MFIILQNTTKVCSWTLTYKWGVIFIFRPLCEYTQHLDFWWDFLNEWILATKYRASRQEIQSLQQSLTIFDHRFTKFSLKLVHFFCTDFVQILSIFVKKRFCTNFWPIKAKIWPIYDHNFPIFWPISDPTFV